jgi:hypothetical protein
MNTLRTRRCGNLQFADRERTHARIAYSRPPGNRDPDRDPASFAALTNASDPAPLVTCQAGPR